MRMGNHSSLRRRGYCTADILEDEVRMGPQVENVGKIFNAERPKTKKDCRSLLGMVNFYRRYIPNCAQIIAPITHSEPCCRNC